MANDTIFFSYSRDDTKFVLNLAKSLRKAGANIWLDQLDIKPGTRWDSSIEKALQLSKTLLVILSKTSVASNNVMDEVSYALGENKKVVPVLLEECAIPFRLRRLQYADFTIDHQKGLKTLAEALNLDQIVADKLTESSPEGSVIPAKKAPVLGTKTAEETPTEENAKTQIESKTAQEHERAEEKQEPAVKKEPLTRPNPVRSIPPAKSKNKVPLYMGGGVFLLLAILWFSGVFSPDTAMTTPQDSEEFVITESGEDLDDAIIDSEGAEEFDDMTIDKKAQNNNESIPTIYETSTKTGQNEVQGTSLDDVDQVNGQNVSIVQYSDGQTDPAGYFRQVDQNTWVEESIIHEHETPFEEVMRDEWSVYLRDTSRDLTIQLNLHTRQVILNYDKPDAGTLYNISDFMDD